MVARYRRTGIADQREVAQQCVLALKDIPGGHGSQRRDDGRCSLHA
jgi:hypothetical protein